MTKKELEQQAKEYGMTVSEIKEYRKHIKPFLRFALKHMLKREGCFCHVLIDYIFHAYNTEFWTVECNYLEAYILHRLKHAKPKDAKNCYWYDFDNEGMRKRIAFCRQQLKLVKP